MGHNYNRNSAKNVFRDTQTPSFKLLSILVQMCLQWNAAAEKPLMVAFWKALGAVFSK